MSAYTHGLKLDEAMQGVEKSQKPRVWQTPGFPIACTNDECPVSEWCFKRLTPHTTVHETLIIRYPNGKIIMGYIYSSPVKSGIEECNNFSNLEELRRTCPELFLVEGTMYEFF